MPAAEVLHRWETERELLEAIADEELPDGATARPDSITILIKQDGVGVISYDPRLLDGNGNDLVFPIQLVSDTTVVPDINDPAARGLLARD